MYTGANYPTNMFRVINGARGHGTGLYTSLVGAGHMGVIADITGRGHGTRGNTSFTDTGYKGRFGGLPCISDNGEKTCNCLFGEVKVELLMLINKFKKSGILPFRCVV